jgi:hypothetical protein
MIYLVGFAHTIPSRFHISLHIIYIFDSPIQDGLFKKKLKVVYYHLAWTLILNIWHTQHQRTSIELMFLNFQNVESNYLPRFLTICPLEG